MKKFLCVVLAAILVAFTFVACSGSKDSKANDAKEEGGTLTMATNAEFPPYEFVEGGEIVGIDAEIAQAIADKLGMELKIENVEFSSVLAGVQSGKYDMGMAGITVTPEREEAGIFSNSYAKGVQVVIVNEDSGITSVDDILDKKLKVGVQTSTTGDIYASDTVENGGFGEENVVKYDNGAVAVQALKSGKVGCVIIDNEPAKSYVAANEGLKILETAYADEDYAIYFSKDDTELRDKVNKALEELIADGTVEKIVNKYINAE
ncbi:MAG: transporter substrate-binding domain-containing protein [Ruminococcaceae bacterium]|nr:transporter substrate-binding domain-containing protein [Oscillospiraceae bacterium]